ncbi:tyrosine-type recombinase/integrase [Streptomyces sp. bgisy060]|uniref:tyrosine-type recombinase/integrase n=1 Tax=Streptomyces sp. bgisy060 TaxID=3413775 RepID=UPI003EC0612B
MSVDAGGEEIVDAELVDKGQDVVPVNEPAPRLLVDLHTVLFPGQELPTTANRPKYTMRDLELSPETAAKLQASDPAETGPMKAFKKWCEDKGHVAVPCSTTTFTEYAAHLMSRDLKASTIKNYMSLVRTAMPPGKKPDNSLYLRLLASYRRDNKRALRRREAFPITLSYLVPMMEKAEAGGRPIGIRDAALFAFGYMFLGRSREDVDMEIEDLTILVDRMNVWLAEDKTHKSEEQTIPLRDRPDVQLIGRMGRWLEYLADHGITSGPVFRHLLKNGIPATAETRAKKAPVRGLHLRPHVVNERVKYWFAKAGLVGDGRPITSHGLRAGAATDLAENGATTQELEEAGRWAAGSPVVRLYVRPAQAQKKNAFDKIPVHDPTKRT